MQTRIIAHKGEWITHMKYNLMSYYFSMLVCENTDGMEEIIFGNKSIL